MKRSASRISLCFLVIVSFAAMMTSCDLLEGILGGGGGPGGPGGGTGDPVELGSEVDITVGLYPSTYLPLEADFLTALNEARGAEVPPLLDFVRDTSLDALARRYAAAGRCDQDDNLVDSIQSNSTFTICSQAANSAAAASGGTPDPATSVEAWMDTSVGLSNVTADDWTNIGIGCAVGDWDPDGPGGAPSVPDSVIVVVLYVK